MFLHGPDSQPLVFLPENTHPYVIRPVLALADGLRLFFPGSVIAWY